MSLAAEKPSPGMSTTSLSDFMPAEFLSWAVSGLAVVSAFGAGVWFGRRGTSSTLLEASGHYKQLV